MLPIPLGANRPWAWGFFEVCIFLLTIFVVIKHRSVRNLGIERYVTIMYLWIAFILLATLQLVPLPSGLVAFLSPESYKHYSSVNALSFYLSIDRSQSLVNFTKLLSLSCLFICVLALVNNERRLKLLLFTIAGVGTWQALYGIVEIVFGNNTSIVFSFPIENKATGSFVYNGHFANFLTLGLAAAIGLLVSKLEKGKSHRPSNNHTRIFRLAVDPKIIISSCIGIMVIALIMSHSRSGNLAFFSSLGLVGITALVFIKKPSEKLKQLIIAFLIINVIALAGLYSIGQMKESSASLEPWASDDALRDAYPIVADYPIFGSGGGSFYSTFPSYQIQEATLFHDHLHNDYLQFVMEYGLLGAFILWGLMVFVFYKTIRAMGKRKHSILKGSAFACLIAFVTMAIQMASDFPLQAYANACYFVIFIAIAMVINSIHLRTSKKSSS